MNKLPKLSQQMRVAVGAGVICAFLTIWIFIPGGFLDTLTKPSEEPSNLLINEQEAEVPAEMSPEKNAEYLAANAKKAGVKMSESGLQYRELTAGAGKQPGPTSMVTVHYKGTFINGKEFDSSYGRILDTRELIAKIEAVDIKEVTRIAGKILTKARLSLAALGPMGTLGSYDRIAQRFA